MKIIVLLAILILSETCFAQDGFECGDWNKKYELIKQSQSYKSLLSKKPAEWLLTYQALALVLSTNQIGESLFKELENGKKLETTQELISLTIKGGLPSEVLTIFSDKFFENENPKIPISLLKTVAGMREKACSK